MEKTAIAQGVELAFPKCVRLESKPHLFCPGCGHPEVLKAFGFAVDALGIQRKVAFGVDIGCSLLAYDFFNIDTIETHHGRTVPTMCGLKRGNPDAISVAYVGDGGAYAIGMGGLLNAAIRDENIFVIVVNNAVYAMTGGQEAPTTLPGTKTATTPYGADNHFVKGPDLIRHVNPKAWIARGITTRQLGLRDLMKQGLQHVIDGKGFAFIEVLSPCTLNWGTVEDPHKTFEILEKQMASVYKLGYF
ncbi:MAG TPA: thiamine pyrophosphate-dependent enzyme [Candidatus Baltobacteraceae bacterium]|nr:thiamine pyrophosphate-dependent enzyme [Candidatus Baltobacteraceae bacterium]